MSTSERKSLKRRRSNAPPPSSAPTPTTEEDRFHFPSDEEDEDDDDDAPSASTSTTPAPTMTTTTLPSHLLPASHSHSNSKVGKNKKEKAVIEPGLIYLSRIPPGMGPSKVKHLLEAYGETGRVFLVRKDPPSSQSTSTSKHLSHNFHEGWIEFLDKRIARSVASLLNAQPIPVGKGGSRWKGDVWTMKYLPRFRWDMLSEQFALSKQSTQSLLRFHLSTSRIEQETYLEQVEKKRVRGRMEEKRAAGSGAGKKEMDGEGREGKRRKVRQREEVKVGEKKGMGGKGGKGKGLEGVLGNLF